MSEHAPLHCNDDKLSPDENIYINAADGLTNEHPIMPNADSDDDNDASNDKKRSADDDTFDDLPTSLIVTNIHSQVFASNEAKQEIEDLFKIFSPSATFQWLRSFRRMRVHFDSAMAAASARIQMHQYQIGQSIINCYFAQPVTPVANKYLRPPAPYKNFLISPPSSPPAGWEPREEMEPLVNHDLLAALANLTPGESHELHPQTTEHPGIVIHTAIRPDGATDPDSEENGDGDDAVDDENNDENDPPNKISIVQTRCPERKSS